MGYAHYTVVRAGQTIEAGYAVDQECDENGCTEQINCGLDNLCGENPGDNESGCGKYFCSRHLYLGQEFFDSEEPTPQLCKACSNGTKPHDDADSTDQDGDLLSVQLEFQPAETSTPFRSTRRFSTEDLSALLLAWDRGEEI